MPVIPWDAALAKWFDVQFPPLEKHRTYARPSRRQGATPDIQMCIRDSVWVEVQNLKRLEAKIVEGPYIHHCVGIHENVVPVLYEACKYIGIAPDLYDPIEEDVKAYLRGE